MPPPCRTAAAGADADALVRPTTTGIVAAFGVFMPVLAVPLGTALGGPLVAGLGARRTLLVSAASVAVLGVAAAGAARAGRNSGR
ncbi:MULTISPECIES: hypothetical protein [Streptomyces]|uniref:hypothetical protein n=1 Tax=Streptomyces TaxID=1883 RepID=UPI002254D6E6|nr:hypothetical protein [Streptomyces sp. NBC_00160]MCX5302147.1 hypothetical protein [Streptomyces sp. NBC_00160]